MKKAAIFDLNGVFIVSSYLSDRFKDDFGIENDRFLPALKEIMDAVRRPGAEDLYSYWKPYFDEWDIEISEGEFLDYWFSAEKENEEMTTLARDLKERGVKLFILSNNFKERAAYYDENFSFLNELFENVYYSWQTGFVKPDEQAYRLILEENHFAPEEVIYFDDSQKNIDLAKSLGIEGYLFTSAEDARKKIFKN